jgi:hypothetical protein
VVLPLLAQPPPARPAAAVEITLAIASCLMEYLL